MMEKKLTEILDLLEQETIFKEYKVLEQQLLTDKDLLNQINLYQNYKDKRSKESLDKNEAYQRYLILEEEIEQFVKEINKRFKNLTKGRKCYENH